MSIFNKLFNKDDNIDSFVDTNRNEPIIVDKEIDIIINILANLGLLKEKEIINALKEDDLFDISILKRMMISSIKVNTSSLEKYYIRTHLGFGTIKLQSIRIKLEEYAKIKINDGNNKEEVVEELIDFVKDDIIYYSKVIGRFNDTVSRLEDKSLNELDFIAMFDYWTNYYKEQELGYPINLKNKIDSLGLELMQLPYGGYGIEEINKFKEAAIKIVEEGKLNKEEVSHTLSRIMSSLFNPKKDRYLQDIEALEKKLDMINELNDLSLLEKEQKRLKTIKEFNVMNGHKQDLDSYIEQLRKNLSILEYGGYGNSVLDQFTNQANSIISEGHKNEKTDDSIRDEIHDEYKRLVDQYQKKLAILKSMIREIDQSSDDSDTKDNKKNELLDLFHDEMGLPINYEQRISNMINELKGLEHGGYGELKIKEFSKICEEKVNSELSKVEIRDALRDLNDYKEKLIKKYQVELNKYYDDTEKIMKSRELTSEEKELAMNDCEREFKFSVGYRMNFDNYIERRLYDLSRLNNYGYGDNAILEFKNKFLEIANSLDEDKDKYDKIKQFYNELKDNFYYNCRLFDEWRRLQLNNGSSPEAIDREARYMISLSPKALKEYLLEDDRIKRNRLEKHNYEVAFKYLAREEAKNDKDIYHKRIKDFVNGRHPYDNKLIEDTIYKLQHSNNTNSEEKIITLTEYIDSTLIRQLMHAEANINKDTNIE